MLSVLIVDDEIDAIRVLRTILNRHCPAVTRCETASSPAEVLRRLKSRSFDLVFLDIHLEIGTEGLDLARQLLDTPTKVVFVTAHEQYAVRAFQLRAHHYLLKPINLLEVSRCVEEIAAAKANPPANPAADYRLRVKSCSGTILIPESDIIRIEGDGSYAHIHRRGQPPIMVSRNLGKLVGELRSGDFVRIHQSHLINLRRVKGYLNNQLVELCDGSLVPVSRRRREALLARL